MRCRRSRGTAQRVAAMIGPVVDRSEEVEGYSINFTTFREDIDATPLLKGLPDDRCQGPHWGYVISGKITFRYADGEEGFEAGDAFSRRPATSGPAPARQRTGTRRASLDGVPADAGYSGTPLPRKLGIREGEAVCVLADPGNARELISPLPAGATFADDPAAAAVVVLLRRRAPSLRGRRSRHSAALSSPTALSGSPGRSALGHRHRHDRGRRPRGGVAARSRRQQGVRDRCHVVGASARLAQGAALRRPAVGFEGAEHSCGRAAIATARDRLDGLRLARAPSGSSARIR